MLTPVMEDETYGLCVENIRGDIGYHGGCNIGFLTEWFFSLREDLCVASMTNRSDDAADDAQMRVAIDLFQNAEEDMAEDMSRRGWKAYCGRYEQKNEDFRLEEIIMKDGDLYARINREDGSFTSKLYPIGKKTFGRKGGFVKIVFGDGCLTVDGITCRKI